MSDSSKTGLVPAAMASPSTESIPRSVGSIRRTSHLDMHLDGNELSLDGSARDLLTEANSATVLGQSSISAMVTGAGLLSKLSVEPNSGDADELVGLRVAGGFRRVVREAFRKDAEAGTPTALLLDDLPVAVLISGYARLYAGTVSPDSMGEHMPSDICSGWRREGTMMTSVRAGAGVPVTVGPRAPSIALEALDDPLGWHEMCPLPTGSMRRRRLVDVRTEGRTLIVQAMFRDTHVQESGEETVLHEYALRSNVDSETGAFVTCAAVPRVLPWVECPVAAASAERLVGQSVEATRDFVSRELLGVSTCTHLNDLLRSLGDVAVLADALRGNRDATP